MQPKTSEGRRTANGFSIWNPRLILLIIAALLFIYPFFGPVTYINLLTEIYIIGLAAMSVNLLFGYSGLLPFGHGMFFLCGAYTVAILAKHTGLPFGINLACGALVPVIIAVVVGYICVREVAFTFAMLTICFNMLIYTIVWKAYSITGGEDGCVGWFERIPKAIFSPIGGYLFTFVVVAVCIFFLWRVVNSPFGWVLRASRENRLRIEAIGINIRRHQLINFVFSGFMIGIAGVLFVIHQRGAYPEFGSWVKSGDFVLMCVLGGMFNFFGPMIGAAIMIALEYWVLRMTEWWPLIMGSIFLFCVLFLRGGIAGFVSERWSARRRGKNVPEG